MEKKILMVLICCLCAVLVLGCTHKESNVTNREGEENTHGVMIRGGIISDDGFRTIEIDSADFERALFHKHHQKTQKQESL